MFWVKERVFWVKKIVSEEAGVGGREGVVLICLESLTDHWGNEVSHVLFFHFQFRCPKDFFSFL